LVVVGWLWVLLRQWCDCRPIVIVFVFSFSELNGGDRSGSYALSVDACYFNTSAKMNRGIDEAFLELSKRMLSQKKSTSFAGGAPGGGGAGGHSWQRPKGRGLIVTEETAEPKKGGCCVLM